jgi:hypothetical protein
MRRTYLLLAAALAFSVACAGCGGGTDADAVGVGAECTLSDECPEVTFANDAGSVALACLTQFAGGYCGLTPCASTLDCPDGSICVTHTDAINYCFRACANKPECNRRRSPENEANCSSNFTWAFPGEDDGRKACIPPSSGT